VKGFGKWVGMRPDWNAGGMNFKDESIACGIIFFWSNSISEIGTWLGLFPEPEPKSFCTESN
jgi:hypothetical protein